MILGGTNIENQTENNADVKSAALSITQLLVFNAIKRSRKNSTAVRHNLERETRLPLYLGLLVHSKARKRDLIDILFEKGLSVSYDRVLQLSTDLANAVIDQFEDVCPTILREGLFTTRNLDNLDHNPTSTSAQTAYHGTALSLTQHITFETTGTERHQNRPLLSKETPKQKNIKPLMESYREVPPATFVTDKPIPSKTNGKAIPESSRLKCDEMQISWLRKVDQLLQKQKMTTSHGLLTLHIFSFPFTVHLQFLV